MSILKFRFDEAKAIPLVANADVEGGKLVRPVAASGDNSPKVRVEHTAAATDYTIGAAYADAPAGGDVTVHTKGIMKLTANEAIGFNVNVYAAAGGNVQAFTGAVGDEIPAGAVPVGRSLSSSAALGDPIWVHKYQ